jgi:hypothetical protein
MKLESEGRTAACLFDTATGQEYLAELLFAAIAGHSGRF